MKKNNTISLIVAVVILSIVYSVLFFAIPFAKVSASYVSYAFAIFSLLACLAIVFWAFKDDEKLVSKFYGFPIFRIGIIYALVQFICSFVVILISAFVLVPVWVSVIVGVVLLAVASIGLISTNIARDYVTQLDESTRDTTDTMTQFRVEIEGLVDKSKHASYHEELRDLSDAFRYSDPVSSEATKETEEEIKNMLDELKCAIPDGEESKVKVQIQKLTDKLNERNRICKSAKA